MVEKGVAKRLFLLHLYPLNVPLSFIRLLSAVTASSRLRNEPNDQDLHPQRRRGTVSALVLEEPAWGSSTPPSRPQYHVTLPSASIFLALLR